MDPAAPERAGAEFAERPGSLWAGQTTSAAHIPKPGARSRPLSITVCLVAGAIQNFALAPFPVLVGPHPPRRRSAPLVPNDAWRWFESFVLLGKS